MYYDLQQMLDHIENSEHRLYIRDLLARQENTINLLVEERNYLREQVSLAIRSLKFDLHPELPR